MDTRLARMAWRNIWRNRRRTLLTLSSIAFGTMLAILFTGLGDANWREMIDLAARLGGGHVSLQHAEYLDTPTLSRTVHDRDLREIALRDPDVERVVTRVTGQLMLSSAGQSYGAPVAQIVVPSSGSRAISMIGPLPVPTFSPM